MSRLLNAVLLSATLLAPLTISPTMMGADEHKSGERRNQYHDRAHNDDHDWNNGEDRAYRVWAKENHRKYRTFSKLRDQDQQAYWNWRHDHSDAQLNINIR